MLTQHIALVPEAGGVSASDLARVSAALQTQVTRDFAPVWGIAATVDAFPQLEEVPIGYWPIVLSADALGRATGIRRDDNGQPYAHLQLGRDWSLAASRVCLEMLVNPTGERTVSGASLRSDQGVVEFLVEVCGACSRADQSYLIHGVTVSDFCMPLFFASTALGGRRRYSWLGSLTAPLELQRGGHLAWYEPISSSWWVRSYWEHNPVDTELGSLAGRNVCANDLIRQRAPFGTHVATSFDVRAAQTHSDRQRVAKASQERARRLRALLAPRENVGPLTARGACVPDLSGASSSAAVVDEDETTDLWDGERSVELELEDDDIALVSERPSPRVAAPAKVIDAPRTPNVLAPAPPSLSFFPPPPSVLPLGPSPAATTGWVPIAALAVVASLAFVWISRSEAVSSDRHERQHSARSADRPAAAPPPSSASIGAVPSAMANVVPATPSPLVDDEQTQDRAQTDSAERDAKAEVAAAPSKKRQRKTVRDASGAAASVTERSSARASRAPSADKGAELFSPLPPNPFDTAGPDEGSIAELLDTRR